MVAYLAKIKINTYFSDKNLRTGVYPPLFTEMFPEFFFFYNLPNTLIYLIRIYFTLSIQCGVKGTI